MPGVCPGRGGGGGVGMLKDVEVDKLVGALMARHN